MIQIPRLTSESFVDCTQAIICLDYGWVGRLRSCWVGSVDLVWCNSIWDVLIGIRK